MPDPWKNRRDLHPDTLHEGQIQAFDHAGPDLEQALAEAEVLPSTTPADERDAVLALPEMDGVRWLEWGVAVPEFLRAWPVWQTRDIRPTTDFIATRPGQELLRVPQDQGWDFVRPLRLPGMSTDPAILGQIQAKDMTVKHFERVERWQYFQALAFESWATIVHTDDPPGIHWGTKWRPWVFSQLNEAAVLPGAVDEPDTDAIEPTAEVDRGLTGGTGLGTWMVYVEWAGGNHAHLWWDFDHKLGWNAIAEDADELSTIRPHSARIAVVAASRLALRRYHNQATAATPTPTPSTTPEDMRAAVLAQPEMDGKTWSIPPDLSAAMLNAWPVWQRKSGRGGLSPRVRPTMWTCSMEGGKWRPLRLPGMSTAPETIGVIQAADMTAEHFVWEAAWQWRDNRSNGWVDHDPAGDDEIDADSPFDEEWRLAAFASLDAGETSDPVVDDSVEDALHPTGSHDKQEPLSLHEVWGLAVDLKYSHPFNKGWFVARQKEQYAGKDIQPALARCHAVLLEHQAAVGGNPETCECEQTAVLRAALDVAETLHMSDQDTLREQRQTIARHRSEEEENDELLLNTLKANRELRRQLDNLLNTQDHRDTLQARVADMEHERDGLRKELDNSTKYWRTVVESIKRERDDASGQLTECQEMYALLRDDTSNEAWMARLEAFESERDELAGKLEHAAKLYEGAVVHNLGYVEQLNRIRALLRKVGEQL